MMKAIRAALDPSDAQGHVRIVCFMTDGYVGNDMEIIAEVQKHPNARVFSFGIGSSVNRFLLDKMAEHGRGEVQYVSLQDDGSAAARRFHERVRNPLLTDISVDWGRLPISDVYPKRIPDLFSAKPVVLYGRYSGSGAGVIKLRGKSGGREVIRDVQLVLPASEPRHDVLATTWARARVDDLMGQDYQGIQRGAASRDVQEAITQLGLDYRLMTQFTSFVAVEEMVVTDGGQPRRINVPVELPEGVSYEGVFGGGAGGYSAPSSFLAMPSAPLAMRELSQAKRSQGVISVEPGALDRADLPTSKLHPSLAAVVARLKGASVTPSRDEATFVKQGRAEIQVWLFDTTPATLAELKKLGFEIVLQPKTGKVLIGRVPIEKLAALAELKSVRYLAPQVI
jgi:Ca-activated chloride channel family protein